MNPSRMPLFSVHLLQQVFLFTVSLILFSSEVTELNTLSYSSLTTVKQQCTRKRNSVAMLGYAWISMQNARVSQPTRVDLLFT